MFEAGIMVREQAKMNLCRGGLLVELELHERVGLVHVRRELWLEVRQQRINRVHGRHSLD